MKITNVMLAGIILLITSFGIVEVNGQYSYKIQKDKNGFYLYGGLNWKFITESRLHISNPYVIDPTFPHIDSTYSYDCFSTHIGTHYNFEIFKSLNLRIGLEWNTRKYHFRLYRDSISKVYYPTLGDYRVKDIYHTIEIPSELAYNIGRFNIGIGAKFIIWELTVWKYYIRGEVDSKHYSQDFLFRINQSKMLHPNVFIEYLAIRNPRMPVWIKGAYEFGGDYYSMFFFSLKTKL